MSMGILECLQESTSISEFVRHAINHWLKQHEKNNLSLLADRLKMPYATLHRSASGLIENPTYETVQTLTRYLLTRNERIKFMEKFHPDTADLFKEQDTYFEDKPDKSNQWDRPDIDKLFAHRDGFLLGQHLISHCGISGEKIKELYGSHGLDIVKALEAKGSVCYSDGVWRMPVNEYFANDFESSLLHAQHSVSTFKPEGNEILAACLRNISQSVTVEAAIRITKELTETAKRIDQITKDNPGNHVIVCNLVSQLLDPKAAIKEYKGENK